MPYKRGYRKRRRVVRRKRRGRRTRRRKGSKGLNYLKVMKKLYGVRRFHQEDLGDVFHCEEGQSLYTFYCEANTLIQNSAIVNSTLGVGGGTFPLGGVVVGTSFKYHISQSRMIHMRNLAEHPQFITCYELAPKVTKGLGGNSSLRTMACDDLFDGWQKDMGVGQSTTTTKEGDFVVTQPNSIQVESFAHHLKMRYSRQFNQNWDVKRSKSFKLNPGDDVYWRMKIPKGIFDPNKLNAAGDPQEGGKYSRLFLIKQTGAIGESAGTANTVASMQSDLAVVCVNDATVIPINLHGPQLAVDVNHDIIPTDLEGPSNYIKVEDDAG